MARQARDTPKIIDCGKPMIIRTRACALSRHAPAAPIASIAGHSKRCGSHPWLGFLPGFLPQPRPRSPVLAGAVSVLL
jgi:hypothetical protein